MCNILRKLSIRELGYKSSSYWQSNAIQLMANFFYCKKLVMIEFSLNCFNKIERKIIVFSVFWEMFFQHDILIFSEIDIKIQRISNWFSNSGSEECKTSRFISLSNLILNFTFVGNKLSVWFDLFNRGTRIISIFFG